MTTADFHRGDRMTLPPAKKSKLSANKEDEIEQSPIENQQPEENQPQPDRLSALPPEIRNLIYEHTLYRPHFYLVGPGEQTGQGPFGLLGVTRQVRQDFLGLFRTAVQEHDWTFNNATAFTTMLTVAPAWILQRIRRLRLRFSAAEALQFWQGGSGSRYEDPETSCENFGRLVRLDRLEVEFRQDEDEEALYESYDEGYDGVVQDALQQMEDAWTGDMFDDGRLEEVELTGDVSEEVRQWAEEAGIVDDQKSDEEGNGEENRNERARGEEDREVGGL